MSDVEHVGNATGGTVIGIVVGVVAGVGFRTFVIDDSAWSITEVALCGAVVCGTLGMIFNEPLMRIAKAIVRLWIRWE